MCRPTTATTFGGGHSSLFSSTNLVHAVEMNRAAPCATAPPCSCPGVVCGGCDRGCSALPNPEASRILRKERNTAAVLVNVFALCDVDVLRRSVPLQYHQPIEELRETYERASKRAQSETLGTSVVSPGGPLLVTLPGSLTGNTIALGFSWSVKVGDDDPLPSADITVFATCETAGEDPFPIVIPPTLLSFRQSKGGGGTVFGYRINDTILQKYSPIKTGPDAEVQTAIFFSDTPVGMIIDMRSEQSLTPDAAMLPLIASAA